jgi:hypothetical protein
MLGAGTNLRLCLISVFSSLSARTTTAVLPFLMGLIWVAFFVWGLKRLQEGSFLDNIRQYPTKSDKIRQNPTILDKIRQ